MIIITNTIMMRLQMNVINNNKQYHRQHVYVCVFYANTCGMMLLPLLLLLHAPKKQKWIFMLRTCATWQSLTAESTEQLLQATACGSCHTLHAAVVVVAIIEAQRWRCCGCCCCCLLNATFVGSFCCVIVSKKHVPLHTHLCGKLCDACTCPCPSLLSLAYFMHV